MPITNSIRNFFSSIGSLFTPVKPFKIPAADGPSTKPNEGWGPKPTGTSGVDHANDQFERNVMAQDYEGNPVDLGKAPKANGPIADDMIEAFKAGGSALAEKQDKLQDLVDKYTGNKPAQRAVRAAFNKGEELMP